MLLIIVVLYVGEDANCTNDGNKRKDWILYKNMDERKWRRMKRKKRRDENEGGLNIEGATGEFRKRPRMIQGMYFKTLWRR